MRLWKEQKQSAGNEAGNKARSLRSAGAEPLRSLEVKNRAAADGAGALHRTASGGLMLSPGKVNQLRHCFEKFDLNKDGHISAEELEKTLRCVGATCSSEDIAAIIEEFDEDSDGRIDVEEFIKMTLLASEAVRSEDEDLRQVFNCFDRDKNGFICAKELQAIMESVGERGLTVSDCKQMLKQVDKNGDGLVDFREFKALMSKPCELYH